MEMGRILLLVSGLTYLLLGVPADLRAAILDAAHGKCSAHLAHGLEYLRFYTTPMYVLNGTYGAREITIAVLSPYLLFFCCSPRL